VSRDRQQDTPFRIALLGDFTGRGNRGAIETGRALAARRPVRVDRDDMDDAIGRLSPELLLPVRGGSESGLVRFSELDDFHPDRLYDRLPRFRALRETRERASVAVAAGDLGRQSGRASGTSRLRRAASPQQALPARSRHERPALIHSRTSFAAPSHHTSSPSGLRLTPTS
jgi:hypothetical protein